MKRITTTFFICLLLGITSLHAERDNYTQRTPEKQPEFITGFPRGSNALPTCSNTKSSTFLAFQHKIPSISKNTPAP